ncbi:MAG: hypothetical protein CMP11_03120, partial [Zetaproteobacteria bacterium]|nr:hypothetical protein [Pseudobdellovibrionaceae bacterium]
MFTKNYYFLTLQFFILLFGTSTMLIAKNNPQKTSIEEPLLPGLKNESLEFQKKLNQTGQKKQNQYKPRTHHWQKDGSPRFTNRLITEISPYLLQHA